MHKLTLAAATTEYDHTRDLVTGDVEPEGLDIIWMQLPVEEIFYRFIVHREWDVSEVSMAKYCSLIASGDDSVTGIPVFLSRAFRHSSIFVRADSGLSDPRDLSGRRVGIPEWAQTAAVYSRGLLAHEYGVDLREIRWVQGGVNQAGRHEKVRLDLPDGITCTRVEDRSLNDLLLDGELDAILSARPPVASHSTDGRVVPLLDRSVQEERQYFERTGIFPIMHTVALKRDLVDRHPWVPMSLFKAFVRARDRSLARMADRGVSRVPMPWLWNFTEDMAGVFGDDPWPYGIEANATTLDTFLQYAYEQGVCARRLTPQDLFAPQVDAGYRV